MLQVNCTLQTLTNTHARYTWRYQNVFASALFSLLHPTLWVFLVTFCIWYTLIKLNITMVSSQFSNAPSLFCLLLRVKFSIVARFILFTLGLSSCFGFPFYIFFPRLHILFSHIFFRVRISVEDSYFHSKNLNVSSHVMWVFRFVPVC